MPRLTRKALAEDAPSRSSPRASTRASTAAAASPSPAKGPRGRRGKAEEEAEPKKEVETKTRGRSTSRGKAAAAAPAPASTGRQSRSRGKSAGSEAKKAPTPARRGRGKAKKEEPEEEEEEEMEAEEEEEENEEEEEEEVTPKRGRGRAQSKGKSPAAAKKSTPPARGGRGSRRSAEAAAEEKEEAPKASPRTQSKRRSGGTPQSRSKRGRGAGEPEEEKEEQEEEEKVEETKEEENVEAAGEGVKAAEESASETVDKKEEPMAEEEKTESPAKEETSVPDEEQKEAGAEPAAETEVKEAVSPTKEKLDTTEEAEPEKTEAPVEEKAADEPMPEPVPEPASEPVPEPASEPMSEPVPAPAEEPVPTPAEEPVPAPAEEPVPEPVSEPVSVPAEEPASTGGEPMEEDVQAVEADTKNGDMEDSQSAPKTGVKRKMEEEDTEEQIETEAKRVRLNGTEPASDAADAEMKDSKPAGAEEEPSDSDVLKDFVVVNKDDLPAPDSSEVAAAVPAPVEDAQPPQEEKMEEDEEASNTKDNTEAAESVTVVPLTEAEVAKAYASEVQAKERSEQDDVSSTIVEVGSVAGSDITGGLSRGLDASELQSASNSIDGDHVADSSINEGVTTPDVPPDFVCPAPQEPVSSQPSNDKPASLGVEPEVTQTNTAANGGSVPNDTAESDKVQPATEPEQKDISQSESTTAPVSMETDATPAQNCEPPSAPVGKGSSSVTESLGQPDPAFLAKYSSRGITDRAYVPNPAVPADSFAVGDRFSVVSYNILAECHRLKGDYSYTEDEFLGQGYRHELLMKELQYLDGDVVCLQEVSPDYFNTTLLPALKSHGYDGLLKCRTKEGYEEGEATFYKTSVFELLSSKGVSLTEVAHKEVESGGLSPEVGAAINKYLDRADVVLITQLRCKASGKVVTVGNIHVVWDFLKSPDVQCIQAACGIKEVVGVAGSDGAHIICGDFNSEWSSPAYQLVLDGYLSDSSIHSLQAVQKLELNDGAKSLVNHLWRAFQHTSSNLKSAYSTVTKSEPEITTYTENMMNAVDYVFYSAGSLVPVGVLKTIDYATVEDIGGLPSKEFPSDHLSMKALMAFSK